MDWLIEDQRAEGDCFRFRFRLYLYFHSSIGVRTAIHGGPGGQYESILELSCSVN